MADAMAPPCFASSFLPPSLTRHAVLLHSDPARRPASTPRMTAFRKYHGLGNDFVLIDNRASPSPVIAPEAAVSVCDRHTGVGADGVIFLLPATQPDSDFAMRLFNSDGSEPEMCGNGIRCLARFAHDLGLEGRDAGSFRVDTGAGLIVPEMRADGTVCVDMGPPILKAVDVPTRLDCNDGNGFVDHLRVQTKDWPATAVSMGNPHSVIFVSDNDYVALDARLEEVGPVFEAHEKFPAKTNTHFVKTIADDHLDMLVWERGAGRTRACGTGACAVLVAAVLTGRAQRERDVTVTLPGGDLSIRWADGDDGHVFMTGPAELVFSGELAS